MEYVAPDGAWRFSRGDGYNDAAPMALIFQRIFLKHVRCAG
jgi:hypothetical protein